MDALGRDKSTTCTESERPRSPSVTSLHARPRRRRLRDVVHKLKKEAVHTMPFTIAASTLIGIYACRRVVAASGEDMRLAFDSILKSTAFVVMFFALLGTLLFRDDARPSEDPDFEPAIPDDALRDCQSRSHAATAGSTGSVSPGGSGAMSRNKCSTAGVDDEAGTTGTKRSKGDDGLRGKQSYASRHLRAASRSTIIAIRAFGRFLIMEEGVIMVWTPLAMLALSVGLRIWQYPNQPYWSFLSEGRDSSHSVNFLPESLRDMLKTFATACYWMIVFLVS